MNNIPELKNEKYLLYQALMGVPSRLVKRNGGKSYECALKLVENGLFDNILEEPSFFTNHPNKVMPLEGLIVNISDGKTISDNDRAVIVKLFHKLLDHGADPNLIGKETGLQLFELLFSYRNSSNKENAQLIQDMIILLLKRGKAEITERVASEMKLEIQSTRNKKLYGEFLLAQKKITQTELDMLCAPPPSSNEVNAKQFFHKLIQINVFLSTHSQYKLNTQSVDIEEIETVKEFKKDLKQFLKGAKDEEKELLQKPYDEMTRFYDQIVTNHLVLNELRSIRKELKKLRAKKLDNVPTRLIRFYSLWSDDQSYTNKDAEARVENWISSSSSEHKWKTARTRFIRAAKKTSQFMLLQQNLITWVHGTRSGALPGILEQKALDAKGNLEKKGVITFTGENCGSSENINMSSLSGERFSLSWQESVSVMLCDAATRSLVSFLYASQNITYFSHGLQFKPEEAWERLSTKHIESVMLNPRPNDWIVLKEDILRVRSVDDKADEKLDPIKKILEDAANDKNRDDGDKIKEFLACFTKKVTKLDEEAMNIVQGNSYPIIFGSTSTTSAIKCEDREFTAKGPLYIGKDIQVAFTSKEKVEELQQMLKAFDILVTDFDTLFYLETEQMMKGSSVEIPSYWNSFEVTQKKLGQVLQNHILPYYALPLPENPQYIDPNSGNKVKVYTPFYGRDRDTHTLSYKKYADKVKKGEVPPRTFHGPMHAARVTLWTQMLISIFEASDKVNPYLLGLAGAFHDIRREDEGIDRWDSESAQLLKSYCLVQGIDIKIGNIEAYVKAIEEKDNPENSSMMKQIVHDADCLEIMRCLNDQTEFRSSELCFQALSTIDDKKKERLIQEVAEFIKLTETPKLKKEIECESDNVYEALFSLITSEQFPLIHKHLHLSNKK